MSSHLNKAQQLLKLKQARRKSAEAQAAIARNGVQIAYTGVQKADDLLKQIIQNGEQDKLESLRSIFAAQTEHAEQQINAVMVHIETAHRVSDAHQSVELAQSLLEQAKERAKKAQQELARSLQSEKKVEALVNLVQEQQDDASD